jgi:hypothetical protein
MKKYYFLLAIISLCTFFNLKAQIPTYQMSNQTVTGICFGVFTDSNAGDLMTGGAGNYGNNENFLITFCSNNSQPITFVFSSLNIKSGDHFIIYDGPDTLSPLLNDFSNYNPGASFNVTSSGTCLTFWFTSDNSGEMFAPNGNWAAFFQCGTYNPGVAALDACADAPSICDFSGYFGNTSSSYTDDQPGNMCESCGLFEGSLENNSWLQFVADNDTVVFTITLLSCSNNIGIQFGVYSGSNCNNFTLMTPVDWTDVDAPITPGSVSTIVATGLVPGQVYYIMIDGNAGDDCQYIIQAQSGMQFGGTITSDQTICAGDTATIQTTLSGNALFSWSSTPTDPSLAGQEHNANISVTPTTTTTYIITSQDASICSNDTLYSTVTVYPAPVATIIAEPLIAHADEAITFTGSTGNGINQWIWNFNYPDGIY